MNSHACLADQPGRPLLLFPEIDHALNYLTITYQDCRRNICLTDTATGKGIEEKTRCRSLYPVEELTMPFKYVLRDVIDSVREQMMSSWQKALVSCQW